MTDRDGLITALRCFTREDDRAVYIDECRARGCPYAGTDCELAVMEDALALLKEREPRVMTDMEVRHSIGNPLWFESRGRYLGLKGFWCLLLEADPELYVRFVQSVTSGEITLSLIDYGKIWRFWTERPSDEQRKEVPWND